MKNMSHKLLADGACYLSHTLSREGVLIVKVHVCLPGDGHQMDMCVGHLEAQHCHAHLAAWYSALDGGGHALGKELQTGIFVVSEVKDIIYLALGYDERVTLSERIDVKESIIMLVFSNAI